MTKETAFNELLDYIQITKGNAWRLGYRDKICYFQFNERTKFFDVDYRIRDILNTKYLMNFDGIKQFIYKELLKHPRFKKIKYVVRFCALEGLDGEFKRWDKELSEEK